jgi:hypothetical protein
MDSGSRLAEAADAVREVPWGRDRLRAQIEAFRELRHRTRVLHALREAESDLKSGGGTPRVLFDRFLVDALSAAGAAS